MQEFSCGFRLNIVLTHSIHTSSRLFNYDDIVGNIGDINPESANKGKTTSANNTTKSSKRVRVTRSEPNPEVSNLAHSARPTPIAQIPANITISTALDQATMLLKTVQEKVIEENQKIAILFEEKRLMAGDIKALKTELSKVKQNYADAMANRDYYAGRSKKLWIFRLRYIRTLLLVLFSKPRSQWLPKRRKKVSKVRNGKWQNGRIR
uniref:uncharacterized protein LOC122594518 n=1 Tax=Erigeron canadensis TaxID=72917 RepID=UPI001CB8E532|nr:uncharacterized protein LOC122594518 [Erigeron canadensis]